MYSGKSERREGGEERTEGKLLSFLLQILRMKKIEEG
jgi:hypothetical protein